MLKFIKNLFATPNVQDSDSQKSAQRLEPESKYTVVCSESEVECRRPDGTVERVAWEDLQYVDIETTDEGPFHPDVFWILAGSSSGCIIPQGATGESELLTRLQQLVGFDNEMLIAAMGSTSNATFLCWKRQ